MLNSDDFCETAGPGARTAGNDSGNVSRRGHLVASVIALLLIAVSVLRSQEPTFSSDVKVVNVLATVRNKQGRIVRNLTKDDFTLDEDGRPQTIRYFSQETDLPLTVGLLVDTSMSQARLLDVERSASYRFLDEMLRENDLAFVIHFDHEVELLQDLTSSHRDLEESLNQLKTPNPERPRPRYLQSHFQYPGQQYPGQYPGQWPGTDGGQWPGTGRRRPGGNWPGGGSGRTDRKSVV